MEYMRSVPDMFFDLAVVDPPYGDIPSGGYMNGTGGGLARQKKYNDSIWRQNRPEMEYFQELVRISKNQIIWGGKLFYSIHNRKFCMLVGLG